MSSPMELLVTLDENYLPHLRVMLGSLLQNSPGQYRVHLVYRRMPEEALRCLSRWLASRGCELAPRRAPEGLFADAPVTKRYPQEMYYRLLAGEILPPEVKTVLYLDPDILIINPLTPLWDLDCGDKVFAAAAHTGKTELANGINRIRLGTEGKYFNSGVLRIDLTLARQRVRPEDIFRFVREHPEKLLLPDQDVLNSLCGGDIYEIDDTVWNYDARRYSSYLFRSGGVADTDWVMAHTAVLHFCGSAKPWKPRYPYRFGVLYQHYQQLERSGRL